MNRLSLCALTLSALFLAGCGGASGTFVPRNSSTPARQLTELQRAVADGDVVPMCGDARPRHARCASFRLTAAGMARAAAALEAAGNSKPAAPFAGYGPHELQQAYGFDEAAAQGGEDRTVAIVDPYDDPAIESDLAVYRARFGLPACTTKNGCFKKVGVATNSDGVSGTIVPALPPTDTTSSAGWWAFERALDVDAVSAVCPHCKILLVEANDDWATSLAIAADAAASLHPAAISNSYYDPEWDSYDPTQVETMAKQYRHPGITITAAAGDLGYAYGSYGPAVALPASLSTVIAVGGTTLTRHGATFSETAWSGTESGCSVWVAKPAWQHDTGCAMRTVADVAFDGDPNTGIAIYSSENGGWSVGAGTSLGAPAIAALSALAGVSLNDASM
ncbi:MAG: hypothetical protein JOZ24_06000, partial [Candidatus Eremiobacteraeota bacterium]|nr:hypothetical protein [Candidatus Eremiobacteraeota bacterium]